MALLLAGGPGAYDPAAAKPAAAAAAAAVPTGKTASAGGEGASAKPDSVSAQVTARSSGHRVEDLSQRTENTSVYANPDGTWTLETADGPERVKDGNGTWHDIDTTLVEDHGVVRPRYAATDLTLSDGGNDPFASITQDRHQIQWRWPGKLPKPTLSDDTATYPAVIPGGDLVVTATATGFTHSILLRQRPSGPLALPIALTVTHGGKLVKQPQGGVVVETSAGQPIVQAPRPMMWDSSKNTVGDPANAAPVPVTVGPDNAGRPTITLTPDAGFLDDPATTYPVTIDPSFTTWVSGDVWVENPNYTTGQTGSAELRVGTYDGGGHIARTFMHFNTTAWNGKDVLSAKLVLRNFYSGSCTGDTIRASRITSSWDGNNLTWGNQPDGGAAYAADYKPAHGYNSSCDNADATWVITDMVSHWADGGFANNGIKLKAPDETSNYTWRKYRSANYDGGGSQYRPHINVTYNSYPNTAATPTMSPATSYAPPGGTSSLYTASAKPSFTSKASDADGGTVKLQFEAHPSKTSSTVSSSCTTGYVSAGSNATCAVGNALVDNSSYVVRSRASDGTDWGAWSGWLAFTVGSTNPPTPTINCPGYGNGSYTETAPGSDVTCTVSDTGTGADAPVTLTYSLKGVTTTKTNPQATDSTKAPLAVTVPGNAGSYTLTAYSASPSGRKSSTTSYTFSYGPPSLKAPTQSPMLTTANTVKVEMDGPTDTNTTPSPILQWRVASAGQDATTGWTTDPNPDLTFTNDDATNQTKVTTTWDTSALPTDVTAQHLTLDPRVPVRLDVQVCLDYPAKTECTWPQSPATVLRVPHAFGNGFPTTAAGPGQVALWTGELGLDATDVTVPGYSGDMSISRSYGSYTGPGEGASGVFGPGWTAQLNGPSSGQAGTDVFDSTLIDGTIDMLAPDGSAYLFAESANPTRRTTSALVDFTTGDVTTTTNPDGTVTKTKTLVPIGSDTTLAGVKAQVSATGQDTSFAFTDSDGTVTTFAAAPEPTTTDAAVFVPAIVQEPGASNKTTYTHDDRGRVTQILAPVPAGVDCTSLSKGCRALDLRYNDTADNPDGPLASLWLHAWNPAKSTMDATEVASYTYDSSGHLATATDQNGLTTSYTYDGTFERLIAVTPPGLDRYNLNYDGNGKLTAVTRNVGTNGTHPLNTIVYDVPTDGTNGTPSLTQADVSAWNQPSAPTHSYAVFGPDKPDVGNDPSKIASADWPYAQFWYTDDRGYTTNTAEYGAGKWLYTDTEYDANDNVTRQLDTGDIAAAQDGADPGDVGTTYKYNDAVTDANHNTILAQGQLLTDTYGPARWATTDNGSGQSSDAGGTLELVRPHTHTDYDQGAPNGDVNSAGHGFGLPTTTNVTADDADGALQTLSQTKLSYDPINTNDPSGWDLRAPTKTTKVMAGGQPDITTITRYNSRGQVIETRQPKSNGSDAGTRLTVYYTTAANSTYPDCGGKPEWAGAVCLITNAADPSAGPAVPDQETTGYNMLLEPTSVVDEAAGKSLRTTYTQYDTGGRVTKTWTPSVTGSSDAPGTENQYDPTTGLLTQQYATDSQGATGAEVITTGYDTWGRVTSYTPAAGQTTTTTYDDWGRIAQVADSKNNTTSYGYDTAAGEHRGLATSLSVSNPNGPAVTFTGSYDAAGNLTTQNLPGNITETTQYDNAGEPVGLTYSGQVTNPDGTVDPNGAWFGWSQDNDANGRVVYSWTPAGAAFEGTLANGSAAGYSRSYTYDRADRLTHVVDQTAPSGGGTFDNSTDPAGTTCDIRDYAFDVNGNRTSLTHTPANPDGSCGPTATPAKTWTYDTADRISNNGYAYDTLGRATTIPAADTPQGAPAGDMTLGYYNTDAIQSITQNGSTVSYTLDPAGRRSTSTEGPTSGGTSTKVVRHYTDTSDNPAWVQTTQGTSPTVITRYAESLSGDLAATIDGSGAASLSVVDLHGDNVSSISVPSAGSCTGINGWYNSDEYGNAFGAVGQTPTSGTGIGYGWLGGKQRATTGNETLLMGLRLYDPVTAQFTSPDPVLGGNTTSYAYPQDPINGYDLTGQCWRHLGWACSAGRAVGRFARGTGASFGGCAGYIIGACLSVQVNYYDGFAFNAAYTGHNRGLFGLGGGPSVTWQSRASSAHSYCWNGPVYGQCHYRNGVRQHSFSWPSKWFAVGVTKSRSWGWRPW